MVPAWLCVGRFGHNCGLSIFLPPKSNSQRNLDDGLDFGNDCGDLYEHYLRNDDFMETIRTQRSFPYRNWNEYDLNAPDGGSYEFSRLWNDGGSRNYPHCDPLYPGCWFFSGLALQLLEIKKTWKVLPLRCFISKSNEDFSFLALTCPF